jgi:lambda repressor-like predicted transcriptional regulator
MAQQKASFMTEPSVVKTPDVAETIGFLRRFADLMAHGYNAAYLRRACDLLESLSARVIATSGEEDLWRSKYETLTRHAGALEVECDALKQDIEGHLDISSSILAERDALAATLQSREAEISGLREALGRERGERLAKSASHEESLVGLRVAFDQKREALQAALQTRGDECDGLRHDLDRERDHGAAKLAAHERQMSELRLSFDRERADLQAQLKTRGDALAALRVASHAERDALKERIAFLEARRAELRSAFDRINYLGNQTVGPRDGVTVQRPGPETVSAAIHAHAAQSTVVETNALVPKSTLRQVRAQFEYLAREFIPRGDIASQVMCELGAYTVDLALVAGQPTGYLAVGEVARSILDPLDPNQS